MGHARKKGTLLSDSRIVVAAVHGPLMDGDPGVTKVQWAMVRAEAWELWLADQGELRFPVELPPWGARAHDARPVPRWDGEGCAQAMGDSLAVLHDENPKLAARVERLLERSKRKFTATYETYTPSPAKPENPYG
jgi:hypothetical protein